MNLSIEPLYRHQHLVEVISRWHVEEFDPEGSLSSWVEAHGREAHGDGVPTALVAFVDGELVGSVSLIEHNMDTRPETPWLAALFVLPDHQRQGIGAALTRRCEDAAGDLGFDELYLYTTVAEPFYRDRGWHVLSHEPYEHVRAAVMQKRLRQNSMK